MPRHYDDLIFNSMSPEEFSVGAARLEAWVLTPGTVCHHVDILRDAMEYKKLNNNLMDKTFIEDLIADIYAWIYSRNVDELKAKETAEENRVRMSVDSILTNPTPAAFITNSFSADIPGGEQHSRVVRRQFSVTRRMIIVRAEALIVKPPTIATPRPAPRALAPAPVSGQSPAIAVVITRGGTAIGEAVSVPGSVPGSVHDSADDESELSDAEDFIEDPDLPPTNGKKMPAKPFFPNLLGARADEDAESTMGEEGGNGTGNEDGEAAEEDVEPELEAEEEPLPGHVPSGGFGISIQPEEEHDEDVMES